MRENMAICPTNGTKPVNYGTFTVSTTTNALTAYMASEGRRLRQYIAEVVEIERKPNRNNDALMQKKMKLYNQLRAFEKNYPGSNEMRQIKNDFAALKCQYAAWMNAMANVASDDKKITSHRVASVKI